MTEKHLTIAVLGAGHIGGTLGKKWVAAGHQVRFGVNDPSGDNAQAVRAEFGDRVVTGTIADALQGNLDAVLVALPGNVVTATAHKYAAQLNGCIIIDAANGAGDDSMQNLAPFRQHAPQAQLYRAFNSLGWENYAEPDFNGLQADLFYCGPGGEARTTVEQLGLLDSISALWFALAFGQKKGRHLAFKVLGD
jgi:8-hydroxy-5-deazaflavin:NADPH oxidoreductase